MSAADGAALIRAKEAADTALRIAVDTARGVGYRDGLAAGRKAGAVEALHLAANESDALGRPFSGHTLSAFARRIESGEVTP